MLFVMDYFVIPTRWLCRWN